MYFSAAFEESHEEQNNTTFIFRRGVRVGANAAPVDFEDLRNISKSELNYKQIFQMFKKLHPSI